MYMTSRERRVAAIGTISVLRHLVLGFMVVALDLLVYWMFDLVHHQAQGDIITRGTGEEWSFQKTFTLSDISGLLHHYNSQACVFFSSACPRRGPNQRDRLRLRHLKGHGVFLRRPAEGQHYRPEQEVHHAALGAGLFKVHSHR